VANEDVWPSAEQRLQRLSGPTMLRRYCQSVVDRLNDGKTVAGWMRHSLATFVLSAMDR